MTTSISNQISSLKGIAEELSGLGMNAQATILLEAADTIEQQDGLLEQLHGLIENVQNDMDAIQPLWIENSNSQGSDHHDHHTPHQQ